jgi:hypothetical protein
MIRERAVPCRGFDSLLQSRSPRYQLTRDSYCDSYAAKAQKVLRARFMNSGRTNPTMCDQLGVELDSVIGSDTPSCPGQLRRGSWSGIQPRN